MSMYRVCFLDKFDTRQYRFIKAYSAKQAEAYCRKVNGWKIRVLEVVEFQLDDMYAYASEEVALHG